MLLKSKGEVGGGEIKKEKSTQTRSFDFRCNVALGNW